MAIRNPIENAVPHGLQALMDMHGPSLLESVPRCESLIRDICGQDTKGAHLLIQALKLQIPSDLLGVAAGPSARLALQRMKKRLEDSLGLAEKSAEWAVATWAFALRIVTDEPSSAVADVVQTRFDAAERRPAQVDSPQIIGRPKINTENAASKPALEADRIISVALKNIPRGWQYMAGQWWWL
jgi:hypothetical protein